MTTCDKETGLGSSSGAVPVTELPEEWDAVAGAAHQDFSGAVSWLDSGLQSDQRFLCDPTSTPFWLVTLSSLAQDRDLQCSNLRPEQSAVSDAAFCPAEATDLSHSTLQIALGIFAFGASV